MSRQPSVVQPLFIDDLHHFVQFCQSIEGESELAIDTEFIPEHTYEPVLALVQVATRDGRVAIIDYGAMGRVDSDPLGPILVNPNVLKVFHSAYADLQVLTPVAGQPPAPIWDTQLVTRLFGYNGRTGYGAIVENLLGERVAGNETLTDWSKRPLSPQQLHYAAEDVKFLLRLYDAERQTLESLGRLAWAQEECERVAQEVGAAAAARADESGLHQNVRGAQNLDRRSLAIVRELAIWRDREARRRNKPRNTILKDDVLVQIGRRAPGHTRQLGELRAMNPRDIDRFGDDLIRAVDRGKRLPEEQCPPLSTPGPVLNEEESALASLLSSVLQAVASRHRVSSTLIATTNDLQRLVYARLRGSSETSPVLTGWRGDLVRNDLLGVLNGQSRVRWDVDARSITIE